MRPRLSLAVALASLLAAAAPAAAAELVTISAPSEHVDVRTARFAAVDPRPAELRANVLLPDGYDGSRRFPVLYLLHGAGDNYASWANPSRGDVLRTARGLQAIVVMPEGGVGFYTNWWNGGRRADPGWERYHLDELIPLVEERFRVMPGRRWHAIAGLSMGGFGTVFYASQRPGYFGTAVPLSGFVSIQRPEVEIGMPLVAGVEYQRIFGPRHDPYARGHNPVRLAANLRWTRLDIYTGNGVPHPGVPLNPSPLAGLVELELLIQNIELAVAARRAGVDVSFTSHLGVHDWPYWREDLRAAIRRGLFRSVPERPARWSYRTIAQTGEMWGLRYAFARPLRQMARFELDRRRLRGEGAGTVTIEDEHGSAFTETLPFERTLP